MQLTRYVADIFEAAARDKARGVEVGGGHHGADRYTHTVLYNSNSMVAITTLKA
jgi:hypothetical protein